MILIYPFYLRRFLTIESVATYLDDGELESYHDKPH